MRKFAGLLIVFILILSTLACHSGTADKLENWTSFTATNGILDLMVTDHEVWAATSGGVVRWDIDKGTSRKYTTLDGLGSNNIRKIVRDSRGNIWTDSYVAGVNRFDGAQWKNFTLQDGLIGDDVITLAADKKGGMWVSAYWGVSYFSGTEWQSFTSQEPGGFAVGGENKNNPDAKFIPVELGAVDVIFVDSKSNVWFSDRGQGVTRFDGQDWKLFTAEDGLAKGGVYSMFEDKERNLWFGSSSGGITRFEGAGFQSFTIPEYQSLIPRPVIQDILQDALGNIWVAAYHGGVLRYDGHVWQAFTSADGLLSENAQSLFLDQSGRPGVITDKGVSRFDGDRWQNLTTKDGLPDGQIRVAVADTKGDLWFGSMGAGIVRMGAVSSQSYKTPDELPNNTITAIAEDKRNNLWFAAGDGSIILFDGRIWKTFPAEEVQAGNDIFALLEDNRGNLWAAAAETSEEDRVGVSLYDGNLWRSVGARDGLAQDQVTALFKDSAGALWFGSDDQGVTRYDGANWITFTTADGLGSNEIRNIAEDKKGRIWVSGSDNVSYLDGIRWHTLVPGERFPQGAIQLSPDNEGSMWFAYHGGIASFDGTDLQHFEHKGLGNPWPGAFFVDEQGNVWVSRFYEGNSRFFRFNGTDWQEFGKGDGLANLQVRLVTQNRHGEILAATDGGIYRFDGTHWKARAPQKGIAGNKVNCMLEDDLGGLWFGTDGGVSFFGNTPGQ